MSETSKEHNEIELIDQVETQKIMTNTISQTDRLTKSDEGEEIVRNGQEKGQEREEKEQRQGGVGSMRRDGEISVEELIESEGEGSRTEVTLSTRITSETETDEISGTCLIAA